MNDANATPMSDAFIRKPNLASYSAIIPGILCLPPVDPALVPGCASASNHVITPAVKPLHDGKWWAKATAGFNFKRPDLNNTDAFNRVLWRGIMGETKPYPGERSQHPVGKARQKSAELKTVAESRLARTGITGSGPVAPAFSVAASSPTFLT
jgi:hypothetical protein